MSDSFMTPQTVRFPTHLHPGARVCRGPNPGMKRAEWKAEHRQPTRAAALQATCGSSVCQSADGSMAVPQSSPSSEHLMPLMMAFPGGSVGKETACNAGDLGLIPGLGRSPEEEMATHSSILAWKIPWTEEPGGLQPMGSQRVTVLGVTKS